MPRPLVEAFKKILLDIVSEIDWKALVAELIASLIKTPEPVFASSDPKVAELRAVIAESTDEDKAEIVEWLKAGAPAE